MKLSVTAIRRVCSSDKILHAGSEGPDSGVAHPDDLPAGPARRSLMRTVGSRYPRVAGFRAILTVVDPRFNTQVIEITTGTTQRNRSPSRFNRPGP